MKDIKSNTNNPNTINCILCNISLNITTTKHHCTMRLQEFRI